MNPIDFTEPQTFTMDWRMIVAVMGFFVISSSGLAYGYAKLLGTIKQRFDANDTQVVALTTRLAKMEARNEHADKEAEMIKSEQAVQRTTVAVMAQQLIGIDRSVQEVKAEQRETNALLRKFIAGNPAIAPERLS